jgi:GT2 family glycosyltransferase
MVQSTPFVSVVIVNHNGIEFVDTCLRSVMDSGYPDFEVIFVDNASSDGSLEYVKKTFAREPKIRYIENSESLGPAVGRNMGVRIARGGYIVFLDNDTRVTKRWINELVDTLEDDASIGAAQAKLLRMDTDNLYDCAGDCLGPLGFLIERSRGAKDEGQLDFIADILSAKSAASIIRKDLFERIGGFDEDFYMYLEETDLSWRVWLAGYRVVFIPAAVVYHAFNTTKKDFKRYYPKYIVRYYGCRNYITTLIKNFGFLNLSRILPLHIGCWLILSISFLFKGNFDDTRYILKALLWNILNIRVVLKRRKFINTYIRKINDSCVLAKVMERRGVGYYFGKARAYVTGKAF